jgi:hypothetical protein
MFAAIGRAFFNSTVPDTGFSVFLLSNSDSYRQKIENKKVQLFRLILQFSQCLLAL